MAQTTDVKMLDLWDYSTIETPERYGDVGSYKKAMDFLDGDYLVIEDWGCGTCYAKNFVTKGIYRGIDGSESIFNDITKDLTQYTSKADSILLRHVLEHNISWEKVLKNALSSFQKRLVIIIYTPFSTETKYLVSQQENKIPEISFKRDDLEKHLKGLKYKIESVETDVGYGVEHLIYIER